MSHSDYIYRETCEQRPRPRRKPFSFKRKLKKVKRFAKKLPGRFTKGAIDTLFLRKY